jgi:hypothetical protein
MTAQVVEDQRATARDAGKLETCRAAEVAKPDRLSTTETWVCDYSITITD